MVLSRIKSKSISTKNLVDIFPKFFSSQNFFPKSSQIFPKISPKNIFHFVDQKKNLKGILISSEKKFFISEITFNCNKILKISKKKEKCPLQCKSLKFASHQLVLCNDFCKLKNAKFIKIFFLEIFLIFFLGTYNSFAASILSYCNIL